MLIYIKQKSSEKERQWQLELQAKRGKLRLNTDSEIDELLLWRIQFNIVMYKCNKFTKPSVIVSCSVSQIHVIQTTQCFIVVQSSLDCLNLDYPN